jgi:hypothetical protein
MGPLFPVVDFQTQSNIILYVLPMIFLPGRIRLQLVQSGPALGGAGPIAVVFKTCSVLLCVLEQPRVGAGPIGINCSN